MNNFTRKVWLVWAGIGVAALCVVALSLAFGAVANAQGRPPMMGDGFGVMHGGAGGRVLPGVFGKVTAINGTTLSVLSGRPSTTQTTYTIDAASTTVMKNGTTSSVSAIAINDFVMVQGSVSGTTVMATKIFDGIPTGMMGRGLGGFMRNASGTRFGDNDNDGDASGSRAYGMHPSGTPPFASGTWEGWHDASSSASGTPPYGMPHMGFFGTIGGFFGNLFGHFRW